MYKSLKTCERSLNKNWLTLTLSDASHYYTLPFSSFLYKTHLFNMENHLLCYTQSLPPNFHQVEPKTGLFCNLLSFMLQQTVIELCVGCAQVSNSTLSIYISHKHWIGQCLWNLRPFTLCHAWVKTPIWLIPSVALKSVQKWKLSQSVLIGCIFLFLDESGCLVLGLGGDGVWAQVWAGRWCWLKRHQEPASSLFSLINTL